MKAWTSIIILPFLVTGFLTFSLHPHTRLITPVHAQQSGLFSSIINRLVTMQQRMKAATERSERFTERLESNITQLNTEGENTFVAEQLLNKAKARVRESEREMLAFEVAVSRAANSSAPYDDIGDAIQQAKTTKTSLIATHDAIRATLVEVESMHEDS